MPDQPYLLVVEDHHAMRRQFLQLIEAEFPRYLLRGAESGEAALLLVELGKPAAVVMDVGLPGMDGIATTRELRRLWPTLGVIVMTMQPSPRYEAAAREAGAACFLNKSTAADRLIPELRVLLGSGAP
ncbi:MAG: hypothetical protein RLZZ200_552 [Pseudomonadota bacterium]|jgi:DNA-binding NarL/FixJ family response regulator